MTYQTNNYQSLRRSPGGTAGQHFAMNQNTIAHAKSGKVGPVATYVLIGLATLAMILFYVVQLSRTGSYGYQLEAINAAQGELVAEQEYLEVDNARMQSLANVKNSTVAAAMTAPSSTDSVN